MTREPGGLERWFLWSLPPVSGRLRCVFYSGSLLLFLALNDGLDFTLAAASPYLYEPRGLAALLGIPHLPPGAMRTLMAITYVAWLFAAIGFMTRPAKWTVAAGLFVAAGMELAYLPGSTHTHYLLLYSFVCLAFSTSDTEWSVDAWLRRRYGTVGGEPPPPVGFGATGLPRHAVLILAVSFYFGAGISKVVDGGLVWIDGSSLRYYISSQTERTSFEEVTWLRTWAAEQGWLTAPLSAATLALELGSPLALLSRPLRHLFIGAWVAMHLGILLLMAPNYWIHSWCLAVLLTDWDWVGRHGFARFGMTAARGFPAAGEPDTDRIRGAIGGVPPPRSTAAAIVLLVPLAVLPPLLQIEWYPLTHVPMYGTYVGDQVVGGIPAQAFGDEASVREIARQCSGGRAIGYTRRCPWRVPRHLSDQLMLTLSGPDREPQPFTGRLDRLRHSVIEHLSRDPHSPGSSDEPRDLEDHVSRLLRAQPPGALDGFDRFSLEYRLKEGTIPLVEGWFSPP